MAAHSEWWFWARVSLKRRIYLVVQDQFCYGRSFDIRSFSVKIQPVPVNGLMSVDLYLSKPELISIEITNIQGQREGVFFTDTLPAGNQQVQIDLNKSDMADGIYFCRVRSGAEESVIKFVFRRE
ncbi:MAG: T9SS type A sorting domain-containing protein [Bacteroidia bacterium]